MPTAPMVVVGGKRLLAAAEAVAAVVVSSVLRPPAATRIRTTLTTTSQITKMVGPQASLLPLEALARIWTWEGVRSCCWPTLPAQLCGTRC